MSKPKTIHDELRLLAETSGPPRDTREVLNRGLHSKSAAAFWPLSLLGSLRLDVALFVHRYLAATLCTVLLLTGGGVWFTFSAYAPARPSIMPKVYEFVAAVPSQQFSSVMVRWSARDLAPIRMANLKKPTITNGSRTSEAVDAKYSATHTIQDVPPLIDEERSPTAVEPRTTACTTPSEISTPHGIQPEELRFGDPPLDYSGFVMSISYEQSSIPADPAHPEFAATSMNDLNYQVGYRFDRYQEAGVGYSRHTYRQIYPTKKAFTIVGGGGGVFYMTTWHDSDDPISLPGIYYTFHANNLEIFGIEPFATVFAGKPSAGFLWRASAGVEWNPWQNLNAVITYSREQLNSATYAAPQNTRSFFDFGLSYRLLP